MAEILPFFAVPFGFAKLENCTPLNQELRTRMLLAWADLKAHSAKAQDLRQAAFQLAVTRVAKATLLRA